jgi:molybdenum cofactor cytidylyltransferase
MRIAAVLLAAGRSMRFGEGDKLAEPLGEMPLGQHAARTLTQLHLDAHFVVAGSSSLDWPGFTILLNDRPEAGMSRSLRLGIGAARDAGMDAALVALADMPLLPAAHFARLIALCRGPEAILASTGGTHPMPPALFGRDWFDRLVGLEGDRGAGALLRCAERVTVSEDLLLDIDTPADLLAAKRRLAARS